MRRRVFVTGVDPDASLQSASGMGMGVLTENELMKRNAWEWGHRCDL